MVKSGIGLAQWARDDCVGQWKLSADGFQLELPQMTPGEAYAAGARALVIGVAPLGGGLAENWIAPMVQALEHGLDIVSGLHSRLSDHPDLAPIAEREGRTIHDIRHARGPIPLATGERRSGKRLLTVGTDCALGKKYTALALTAAMKERGMDADFRATGQTGIMIAGGGIAIDGVIADFVAGAAEMLSPAADHDHWDVIEGQGALMHPAYGGVTLGLLHGSQPDVLILCHDTTRRHINGFPNHEVVSPVEAIELYERCARVTNPGARVVAISLNTSRMTEAEAQLTARTMEDGVGLPCFDPLRFGAERAVDAILMPNLLPTCSNLTQHQAKDDE
ncbi:MAG: DUF1611 domain-containing protein [Pacificimonas sp.]|nr:DUF1611 domain-containing protein [Pacificimonas sp.]